MILCHKGLIIFYYRSLISVALTLTIMDSSRIFIRGLPPNLTAEEFKRHFSKQTEITDAKFIPHRRIGYVGFRSHEDAAKAVKYHHKTFIRMSRIAVELARSVRDLLKQVQ